LQRMLVPIATHAAVPEPESLAVAAQLARAAHGEVVLFTSTHAPIRTGAHLDPPAFLLARAEARRMHALAMLQRFANLPMFADLHISCETHEGPIADAICDAVDLYTIDSIIMHSHGPYGMLRRESCTASVLERTHLPIMILPQAEHDTANAHWLDAPRILVPFIGTPLGDHVLPAAVALAQACQGTLTLLCILSAQTQRWQDTQRYRDAEASLATLQRLLQAQGITASTSLAFGDPVTEIRAKAPGFTLVAMTVRDENGWDAMLWGSTTEQLWSHLRTPLLLIHSAAAAANVVTQSDMIALSAAGEGDMQGAV
jgi:nucleotide-binding universal stress UspA family protein